MSCEEIPKQLAEQGCRQVAIAHPDCCCEAESVQPNLSPGIVSCVETLARFVNAHHLDDQNLVKPSLFSHAETNGMSTTRIERAGPPALADQQIKGNYVGYVSASCRDIRELAECERKLFCVYDTALKDNIFHSDVCQALFGNPPKGMSRLVGIRVQLMRLFTTGLQDARKLAPDAQP